MKLAPRPVRRDLRAKPAPPNLSICVQRASIDSVTSSATSYPLSFQSTAASLPSFFARRPLFSIACSLFSQNTRVGGTSTLPRQAALPKGVHFAKGCKNAETATLTTFRINTCKSVSKQRTLTTFRINTCEKQGEGG